MTDAPQYGQFRPEGESQQQVCYRHPQYPARVRCQRCNRLICPHCYQPAAVGVLCPECAGPQKRRQTSAMFSGVAFDKPIVTYAIAIICVAVYVIEVAIPQTKIWFGFIPMFSIIQPWRFLTTAFLHGSIMHLLLNMLALVQIGLIVETVIGRWKFLALYLLSAFGGSVFVLVLAVLFNPQALYTNTIGASGAVFGMFAALLVIARHHGSQAMMVQIAVLLGINFVWGLMVPGISWQGHLGGALTGALVAAGFMAVKRHVKKKRAQAFLDGGTSALKRTGEGTALDIAVVVGTFVLLVLITFFSLITV